MKKSILLPIVLIFFFIVTGLFIFSKSEQKTNATDFSQFKAGNIMSDEVMSNKDSMSEADISNFIRSKITCNRAYDSVVQSYANQGYQYHVKNGYVVCIADEYEWFGNKTAAHIIYRAAQDYSINPQVLLVLIQKEQGLLSDNWPNFNSQYAHATGFGCPDTAACDPAYSGFENQVRSAAALYREVLSGGWTNYPVGWNYIQYNPDASCGGTSVYVENRATSALYRFTPYQPNPATLSVPMGATVSCGAYGNKNFYGYFTSWFGSTHTATNYNPTIYLDLPNDNYNITLSMNSSKQISNISDGLKILSRNNDAYLTFEKNTDGTYTIMDPRTSKVLDVYNANCSSGAVLQFYARNGTEAQKFYVIQNNDGTIGFAPKCSTSYRFDIPNATVVDGNNLTLYVNNGTGAQKFYVIAKNQAVNNDSYTVKSAMNQSRVLDIASGSKLAGANLQIWDRNNTSAQIFNFTYDSTTGYYKIIAPFSGKSLDVSNASKTSGANIQQWDWNSSLAQIWRVIKNTDGTITIMSVNSGKVLDVANASSSNGANVQQWDSNGTGAQKWVLEKYVAPCSIAGMSDILSTDAKCVKPDRTIDDGSYTVKSAMNQSRVLDIASGSKLAGANLQIWDRNNTSAQIFNFTYDSTTGYYKIIAPFSGKSLDVSNASKTSGANIQQWDWNSSLAQIWRVIKNTDGTITIMSVNSGKVLDVANASSSNGANVQQWDSNGTGAQKWVLE